MSSPKRVLEVGAGEGAIACRLASRFEYTGVEPDPVSSSVASARLASLGRGRLVRGTTVDLKEGDFDLVCAFEVLEHLPDDEGDLSRWRELLAPRGHVLVSVPAHRHRFGPTDEWVGHFRRYDHADLIHLLEGAGFEIRWVEAWGAGLGHLLETVRHALARHRLGEVQGNGGARAGAGWLQPRGRLAGMAAAVLAAPFRMIQYPMRHGTTGIGWVALARRADAVHAPPPCAHDLI